MKKVSFRVCVVTKRWQESALIVNSVKETYDLNIASSINNMILNLLKAACLLAMLAEVLMVNISV